MTVLRRLRGALLMGLIWAMAWLPIGLLVGMIVDPDGSMDEPWMLVGTLPGFFAGVFFSAVLGIAAHRRRLAELTVPRVARWGAAAGLLIGALPFVLGSQNESTTRLWLLPIVVTGTVTLLSAVSAAGSLVLARRSERLELSEGGAGMPTIGKAEFETRELPGVRR